MNVNRLLTAWTTAGLRAAIHDVWRELSVWRRHRAGVRRAREHEGQRGLKLHIGCSVNLKPGWINIDLSPHADISLDLREPLPFDTRSCALVYSEHFLEHLDYPEPTASFLAECLRVLAPGGRFSVGVPDTEWPITEYVGTRAEGYFEIAKRRWHPAWCETEMEHLNYHFRQGDEHRFAYDYETLVRALTRAGFCNVERRAFDPGLDSDDRRLGTLYVDALKPGP